MIEFTAYVNELEELAGKYISNSLSVIKNKNPLNAALDGGPNRALRNVVSVKKLQETGTYFTGDQLANLVVKNLRIKPFIKIFDPACGVGDLLISVARKISTGRNLTDTLKIWGEQFYGFDIHPEFVRAAKIRLLLTALSRGVSIDDNPIKNIDNLFPNIQVKDGLQALSLINEPYLLLLNPPFHPMKVPFNCKWASGKVSSAALFLDKWVNSSPKDTKVLAILPDVLRSGTFYNHWRENIYSKSDINKIKVYGKFDKLTEVDVFILDLTIIDKKRKKINTKWWNLPKENSKTIDDFFEVTVGRVVPYRDAEEGNEYDYIQPKNLPKWKILTEISERRKFSGKVLKAPFVAIRRNSRSDDKYRASGTIINTSKLTAVENHLMVLTPRDGKLKTCKKLLEILKSSDTNEWLNERIRCRHLTVPAVKDIPWKITIE